MAIQCNEINQTINYLLTAFQDCQQLSAADMQLLVELIAAVNTCTNGGPDYNTLVSDLYEPETNQVITLPINTFHAISIVVLQGSIVRHSATFPAGTSINYEVTTLNQTVETFTINAGSRVLVEYITETV